MLGDTPSRRRARRALGPWLVAAASVRLAMDNGPALIDEWRLRSAADRRVTYRFPTGDGDHTSVAFVTHQAADGLQPGGVTRVRYLTEDVEVRRVDGEPGLLLLTFRLLVATALALICIVLL